MSCSRCQKLPKLIFLTSDVYISLPTNHHIDIFEKKLNDSNYIFEKVEEGYLIRRVDFEECISFLSTTVFNSVEKRDVRILPLENGSALSFSSLKHYRSLQEWETMHEGQEVSSIINEGRIKTLFQPIVQAKTGEIYGYEALSRGILKDGSIMNPSKLFSSAKAMDLMFNLDRICRESAIRAASKQGIRKKLFINFIPTAIYEPSLCLKSTARVLGEVNMDADQIVFEVVETEKVEDFVHLNRILDYYRDKGYSTALDDIGSGYSDISALLKLKPVYMKIDIDIIGAFHLNSKNQKQLDEYIRSGKEIGLTILAEGVEKVEEY
ncbi:MAG TPA: EAL domain-containing protein, partial [Bacteroidales bacterium]|nr:EAL domain-containing protein [Bacteroidales bacterium]